MIKEIINKDTLLYIEPSEVITISNKVKKIAGELSKEDTDLLNSRGIDKFVFAYAFENDVVKKVKNCKNITHLLIKCFINCSSLEEVDDLKSLEYIGDYAFCNCTNLKVLKFSNKVKYIGAHAFSGIKNLTINFNGTLEEWDKIEKGCDLSKDDWMPDVLTLNTKDTTIKFFRKK